MKNTQHNPNPNPSDLFTYQRRKYLDVNGNPLYYVYPINGELPAIKGYLRRIKQGYYLVQSYNIEADLHHLAPLYTQAINPTVEIIDIHDDNDTQTMTLSEARDWLRDFWIDNPNDDMSEREQDDLIHSIMNADIDKLDDHMQGIGFTLELKSNTKGDN